MKLLFTITTLLVSISPLAAEVDVEGAVALRYSHQHDAAGEWQYKAEVDLSAAVSDHTSLHFFATSGADFDSQHNEIGEEDEIHLRRVFARFEGDHGKFEVGSIPPYKGRVSSTGLADSGWIKGARGVLKVGADQIELVIGELDDLSANRALSPPDSVDYVEFEYSSALSEGWAYEVGLERMLGGTFLRGELRWALESVAGITFEIIGNTTRERHKTVVGYEHRLSFGRAPIDVFAYYAFTHADFGRRAELTEDFLDIGHAFAVDVSGTFLRSRWLQWGLTLEVYEGTARGQFELEALLP